MLSTHVSTDPQQRFDQVCHVLVNLLWANDIPLDCCDPVQARPTRVATNIHMHASHATLGASTATSAQQHDLWPTPIAAMHDVLTFPLQAGLMVLLSPSCWLKTSVEHGGQGRPSQLGVVATNAGYSDWSTMDVPGHITKVCASSTGTIS